MKRSAISEYSHKRDSFTMPSALLMSFRTFSLRCALIIFLWAALLPCGLAQGQVYVDIDRAPGGDGASWETAFRSIQTGIDTAVTSGIAQVWVAEGVYEEAVTLASQMRIYGGFAGNEEGLDERVWDAFVTTIDGNGATHVIAGDSLTSMTLDGFTITGGSALGAGADGLGAGLYLLDVNGSSTIRNCLITENNAINGGGAYLGAGTQLTLDSCTFADNTATTDGAGLYIVDAPLILGCTITGNIAGNDTDSANGGGAYCAVGSGASFISCNISSNEAKTTIAFTGGGGIFSISAETLISSCTLSGNISGVGGGALFFLNDAATTAVNCIISGNFADDAGGAIVVRKASPSIINCTIIDNDTDSINAGGISFFNSSNAKITNVIFAGNTAHAIREQSVGVEPIITNCIFYNNPDGNFYDRTNGSLNTAVEIDTSADPPSQTSGNLVVDPQLKLPFSSVWTNISYNAATTRTILTDDSATFTGGALIGELLNFDTTQLLQALITSNTATTIVAVGDLTGLAHIGDAYALIDYNPSTTASPVIDAGASIDAPAQDIDGVSRPDDIPAVGADGTGQEYDIGAYEFHYPGVALSSTTGDPTDVSPIPVTVQFDEDIIGFEGSDIATTNGLVQGFSQITARTFTFELLPTIQDLVEAVVPAGVCTDTGGNPNTASATFSRIFNTVKPVPTLSTTANNPTSLTLIPVTAFFDKAVKDFSSTDLDTTNCSVLNFAEVTSQTFTFDLSPAGQGLVEVVIPAGVCTDDSENPNLASPTLSRSYDSIAPTVTMTSSADEPTSVSPITVAVSFNEAVTGFTIADITPGSATVTNFWTFSAQSYQFTLAPTGQGAVTADIAGGAAFDAAFNPNTAATQFTRTYDSNSPTVLMSSTANEPTSATPIAVVVAFNEDVTGFTIDDITPGNATVGNFQASSAQQYTFDLTPSGQGTVTADIAGGAAFDAAFNPNTAATQFTRTYDTASPTVSMTSTTDNPTNASPIAVTANFNEDVAGFTIADITPGNATVGNFQASSAQQYTFELTPAGQGIVTANIAGGAAFDAAGNANTAAAQFSRAYDSISPTVAMSSTANEPTSATPIVVTVAFNEDVTGFTIDDITPSSATVSNFLSSTARDYQFSLFPAGQGTMAADLAGGAAFDAAGNPNTAATQFSRTFDSISPNVTLSSTAGDPTAVSPIEVTVEFDEVISGFASSDIATTNGAVQNFAAVTSQTFTFDLAPMFQGLVEAAVPAGGGLDAAGNPNAASSIFSRTYDSENPSATLISTASNPTSQTLIPVTAQFDEGVIGFQLSDLATTNCTVQNFNEVTSLTFTLELLPAGQGLIEIGIPAGVCVDDSDNPNTASAPLTRIFDSIAPDVSLSSTAAEPTNASPIAVMVDFTEDVVGFTIADITPGNATVSNFLALSAQQFSFELTPIDQGAVTADIDAGAATDAAGNPNPAATQLLRNYDSENPDVSLTSTANEPTNATSMIVTAQFNEDVTGFTIEDLTPGNATVSNFQALSARQYTFDLTPQNQGAITVDIGSGVAFDAAGNPNSAAAQFTRTYDSANPTVILSSTANEPTNVSPIPVIVQFSEDVLSFEALDIEVTNGVVQNFAAITARTFSFDLAPTIQGAVSATIAAGACTDHAGNPNLAATPLIRTYDSVFPNVVLSSTADNPTSISPIVVIAQFDEEVTGFDAPDIVATNAIVQNFAALDSLSYGFELVPAGQGPVSASVPAGVCTDLIGNLNTASNLLTRTFDSLAPQSAITLPLTGVIVQATTFTLAWTSSDAGGVGVEQVELFFRQQGEAAYRSLGVFPEAVQSVVFDSAAHGGNGVYELYSVALDTAGNEESAPAQPDAIVTVNTELITFQELRDYLLGRLTLSPAKRAAADVNGDGRIDIADLLALLKK